ncbi:MAG: metalloregulator ArsR/SmtB family transcription factor [Peptococcaceae bacterium]|nr:metalloregulator ArsR/SmtB family transcription factor [Peptococcaceae bacterium]
MNQLTNIFKGLSDETRLRILVLLYQEEELCVCELSGILEVPQPRISQNLTKFRDMNLVIDKRKEKYIYYSLKKENKILLNILKDVVDDIGSYPKLSADKAKISYKEKYLKQYCGKGY